MKRFFLPVLALFFFVAACNKTDENLVSNQPYLDVVYQINNAEPDLAVTFSRGVFSDNVKGNLDHDTTISQNGLIQIPATILKGINVRLYAISYTGGDFNLQIRDTKGNILAQTDSVTFDPANQLHADRYFSNLLIVP